MTGENIYKVEKTTRFKKDIERCMKRGKKIAKLDEVVRLLKTGDWLPPRYCEHKLVNAASVWECHIEPDWLLVYQRIEERLVLILTRTGTHADLFK